MFLLCFLLLFPLQWEIDPKKYCYDFYQSVLPVFSSMVSSLTFRSLIHFELIFACDVRECSIFYFYLFLLRLINNVLSVSAVQPSDPVIHMRMS